MSETIIHSYRYDSASLMEEVFRKNECGFTRVPINLSCVMLNTVSALIIYTSLSQLLRVYQLIQEKLNQNYQRADRERLNGIATLSEDAEFLGSVSTKARKIHAGSYHIFAYSHIVCIIFIIQICGSIRLAFEACMIT